MKDDSHINMLDLASRYTELKLTSRYKGGQHSGPCPVCNGGDDRFNVWVGENAAWCRQCNFGGGPLVFYAAVEGLDLRNRDHLETACKALGIAWDDGQPPAAPPPSPTRQPLQPDTSASDMGDYAAFSPEWQHRALSFIEECSINLWEDDNFENVRSYLFNHRGLNQAVVLGRWVGFNPTARTETWAGQEVYLPRGVVLPWIYEGTIWRIRFRTTEGYKQVAGAANGLYYTNPIFSSSIVVLVEGEFDAMAIRTGMIATGRTYPVTPTATGGTTQGRVLRHVAKLSAARHVLVAYDADQPGEQASKWWLERLPNATRLKPTGGKDANEMLIAGDSILQWIVNGFKRRQAA